MVERGEVDEQMRGEADKRDGRGKEVWGRQRLDKKEGEEREEWV